MRCVGWSGVIPIAVVSTAISYLWLCGTSPEPETAAAPPETEAAGADIRLAEVVAVADVAAVAVAPECSGNLFAAVEGGPHEVETGGSDGIKPPIRNADFVAFLRDTSTPLSERRKGIEDMARRGDERAFEALAAAAEARIYLNWVAVRALGDLEDAGLRDRAVEFLRGKMRDPDMRVACEALRSYGRLLGEEAVPLVAASIEENRNRPDGHGDIVASTAVGVLAEIASPEAVPALSAELERSEVLAGDLEYGSEVVRALERTRTPEARKAIAAYADDLAKRIPEDRLAGRYYETKIAEARACLDRKEREEVTHD